ncbi:ArdC-like ssDNA-binding domain-containing protein [Snodgrassella alvi]
MTVSRYYNDPRWLTYRQAQFIGAQVRKGELQSPCTSLGIGQDMNQD